MQKTVVLNIVGLTPGVLGVHTPFLTAWAAQGRVTSVDPVLPAVTCSVQSTYLTGQYPEVHGIVGNGWYYRDDCEVKFWKQSNKLVKAPKIWERAKEADPAFTCCNMFWWYNMYSEVDYSVTPRPNYLADGRKIPDVYSCPATLRDELQSRLGTFPLFDFWGPRTSIRSTKWIADASMLVDRKHNPALTLIYLPHLDYGMQKYGTDLSAISKDLNEIDGVCKDLIEYYEAAGAAVILLSEYGITNVNRAVALNRVLRQQGYVKVREERGLELLDAGASKAFAVADHQVGHIYINDKSCFNKVKEVLGQVAGVEQVLDKADMAIHHLGHERSGDLIAVADSDSWFSYYYWLDDKKAPDFARMVDIHNKPGYDPAELFTNPEIKFLMPLVTAKLMKKKLGFRTLMDIIPLDASLVKGSHGRIAESVRDRPVLITKNKNRITTSSISPTAVYDIIWAHLFS